MWLIRRALSLTSMDHLSTTTTTSRVDLKSAQVELEGAQKGSRGAGQFFIGCYPKRESVDSGARPFNFQMRRVSTLAQKSCNEKKKWTSCSKTTPKIIVPIIVCTI